MRKKIVSLLCISAMVTGLLAGCAKNVKVDPTVSTNPQETSATVETSGDINDDTSEAPNEDDTDEEPDYTKQADDIMNQVTDYLQAFKNGDMEKILAYTDPDSDDYKYLEKFVGKDTSGELFKVLFSRLVWEWSDENKEDLMDSLEYNDGEFTSTETILVNMANPIFYMFDTYYGASLEEGTEFEDDFDGGTEENAKAIAEKAVEVSPLEFWDQLDITYVDGQVLVDTSEFWHVDDFMEKLGRYASGTYLFRLFVAEEIDIDNFKVVKDAPYKYAYAEEHRKLLDAAEKMDLEAIEDAYANKHGSSILTEESNSNWHTVDDLDDAKKEILNNIFGNKENIVRSYLAQNLSNSCYQRGSLVILIPAEYYDSTMDEQTIDFVRKNNVKETIRLTPPLSDTDTGAADSTYLRAYYKVINNLVEKF